MVDKIKLDIVSDVVCPWCTIGYKRLQKAIEELGIEDKIVESVVNSFLTRSAIGIEKYGTTLNRTDLSSLDWINHAQEEAMDLILYLEKIKVELSK